MAATAAEHREDLRDLQTRARGCVRCPELARTRTSVVFGAGSEQADLMFVGEAPGRREDELGVPIAGAAGELLEQLLAGIGMSPADVYITNILNCRPPGNRDPHPLEVANCDEYLRGQVALIRPAVLCTLGNFATKLLRGDATGITRLHGRDEVRTIGERPVRLLPLFHPAAALYTPASVETLRRDFARIPELLAMERPPAPPAPEPVPREPEPAPAGEQLGLF